MTTPAQDLFARALELPESQRDAFLAEACGDDAELHLEVQRMLVVAARADSFFGDTEGTTLGAEEFKDTYAEKEGDVIGPYKLRQQIGEGGFGIAKATRGKLTDQTLFTRFEQFIGMARQAQALAVHFNAVLCARITGVPV